MLKVIIFWRASPGRAWSISNPHTTVYHPCKPPAFASRLPVTPVRDISRSSSFGVELALPIPIQASRFQLPKLFSSLDFLDKSLLTHFDTVGENNRLPFPLPNADCSSPQLWIQLPRK